MSEQGNFAGSANFGPQDVGVPYPRPTAIHLVSTDLEVPRNLAFNDDPSLKLEEKLIFMMEFKRYLGVKHRLSLADTTIALMAYEDVSSEALELARTQKISEDRAKALERITDYLCSPRRIVRSRTTRYANMKRAAHAN
jgi:hypothetical protein